MAKPYIHADSSAKKFGGEANDFLEIHQMMDSTKESFPDNRHRAIFHTAQGCFAIERMFGLNYNLIEGFCAKYNIPEQKLVDLIKECRRTGTTIKNANGKQVAVRDVAEQHILEDNAGKFIPSLSDYLSLMEFTDWMNNGKGVPPSNAKIFNKRVKNVFPKTV